MATNTLRVAVFDFCNDDCTHTARAVRTHFAARRLPVEVGEFDQIQAFVYDFKEKSDRGTPYDMAFVGVDDMMGAEVARHIRGMDGALPLFLVSKVGDFGLEGFRLRALDYLTKPVSADCIAEAVARITMPCFGGFRTAALLDNGTQQPPHTAAQDEEEQQDEKANQ